MKLRRWLVGAAGVIAFVGLIVVAGLWWVYATESGARFVAGRLLQAAAGAVSVETIDGTLRDSLELRGVRYADSAQSVQIDTLALSLGLSGLLSGSIEIEDLRSSVVEYRALANGPGTGPDAGTAAADDAAGPPVSVPVRLTFGRVSIAGLSVDRGDGEPLVVDRITLSGSVFGSRASLRRFETRWQGFFLSSQGNLAWSDGLELNGILSWSGQFRDRNWLGSIALQGRWPELAFEQELLEPLEQTASGALSLTQTPTFEIAVTAAGVGAMNLAGRFDPAAQTLELALAGSDITPGTLIEGWPGTLGLNGNITARIATDYRIATDDLVMTARAGPAALEVDFAGAFDASRTLAIDRLEAVAGRNRIRLSGEAGPRLDLALAAELDDLAGLADLGEALAFEPLTEIGPALTALRGRAAAELAITGTPETPQITGQASVADATLAELPFALRAEFSTAVPLETPGGPSAASLSAVELDAFEASLGATRLTASGTVGAGALGSGGDDAAIDLLVDGSFGDLGEIAELSERQDVQAMTGLDAEIPELAGTSQVSLTVRGTRSRPAIVADLRFGQVAAGLPWEADGRLQTTLELFEGGRADFSLAATTEAFEIDFAAVGALADGGWRGQLRTIEIDERVLGSWRLDRPAALALAPGRISLEPACLRNGESEVCAEWRSGGTDDGLRLRSDAFELATLDPLLPATMTLGGRVALDLGLRSLSSEPEANLSIDGEAITLVVGLSETDRVTTEFDTVSIDATLENSALTLMAGLTSPTAGRASLSMRSADVRDRAAPIDGRVDILWPDLGALTLLSPDIGEVGGTLNLAIMLAGTADEPAMSGTAALREGRIAIPEWDVLVERIEAEALSFDGGTLEFSGSGFIEDSEISISGSTELDPEAGWPTRVSLSGENVPVSRRPDAMVYASPDFDVSIELPRIDVSGSVFVPEAAIAVEQLPVQAVRVSPDSVVHGMTEVEPMRPLEVTADVAVELGDDVHYSGSNLDTSLTGRLRLQYESGLSPTASGRVRLDGSYDAYGQSLDLTRGELLFAGPLDDPAIDVRAVRRIGSTTVGIDLTGTLLAPEASLFSEPAMSEANALSYLMFGRPLSSTSDDEETATLESTALALGLQQALPGIQRVGQTIGLDELSIAANDVDAGALMAGKYLSPKLYMSYTYGLFNRLGGFLLRYEINDRLALETRSGSEKSMDLLYSIEKE